MTRCPVCNGPCRMRNVQVIKPPRPAGPARWLLVDGLTYVGCAGLILLAMAVVAAVGR